MLKLSADLRKVLMVEHRDLLGKKVMRENRINDLRKTIVDEEKEFAELVETIRYLEMGIDWGIELSDLQRT